MKTKVLLTSFITLCLTYAGCVALTIKMANINECGYANNFNEIPGIKEEKLFSPNIHTEGNLFFQRTGYLSHFALYIIGKFSTETFEKLINDPRSLALPLPCFSYEDHSPINGYWLRNVFSVNSPNLCRQPFR